MTISADTFAFVADLVRRRSAILLEPGKEYLVESRLLPLARAAGLSGVDAFVADLRTRPQADRTERVVEALTTNETSWFRDVAPFQALAEHVVPDLVHRGGATRLRVWSAACSTGQEPYSIAITLADLLGASVGVEVLATDLNAQVLERAAAGTFTQLEVNRGLPAPTLVKHFRRAGSGWQVADELRRAVTFRRHNLLDPAPGGPFDVVFLRNVLIYFDLPTKRAVLERVRAVLRPGGYLVLGAAETTIGVHDAYERVVAGRATVYRVVGGPAPRTPGVPVPAARPAVPAPAAPLLPTARPGGAVLAPTSPRGAGLT